MKKIKLLLVLFTWPIFSYAQKSAYNYIEKHKDIAIQQSKAYGIPASIILGVAMHESGNGTSKVARVLNNHFGIKGKNNLQQKLRSAYKSYESDSDSYLHFVTILKNKRQYQKLKKLDPMDYKAWAYAIHRSGYAASKTWAKQVIATIQKYRLWELDKSPATTTDSHVVN